MSIRRKIAYRAKRRAQRVRKKFTGDQLRVSVFRSLSHIYAQIINDKEQRTLLGASSSQLDGVKGDKCDKARELGKKLASQAVEQGIKKVSFDRGSYRYHGRVKSLAEGLREGGLEF